MNNLGKLIERRIKESLKFKAAVKTKVEQYTKHLDSIMADRDALKKDVSVINAIQSSTISLWSRRLAMEKRRRELVAGGDIIWKPVDSTARRVIQKAPWWSFPVPMSSDKHEIKSNFPYASSILKSKPNKPRPETKPKPKTPMNDNYIPSDGKPPDALCVDTLLSHKVAGEFVKRTDQSLSKTEDLMRRTQDARAAMEALTEEWKTSWLEFQKQSDERLKDFRMFRMAMDSETRQLMASVREVRQFFLDKDYEQQRNRLEDFVELCERLKALKESGFLDTVADTMLRLS